MIKKSNWKNKLYYGDNLNILREYIADEIVDLIYLDPPFNSQATYNVLFKERNGSKSAAQIKAFKDTWSWNIEAEKTYHEIVTKGPKKLADLMQALRAFIVPKGYGNDMLAYLTMMAIRLIELHRVLKPTGSIYLHCDPTASHYLKLIMDAVFGYKNYLNEIAWCYKEREIAKRYWNKKHDILLFYCKEQKNKQRVFNWIEATLHYSPGTIKKYNLIDENWRKYQIRGKGGSYIGKQQLDPQIEKEHPEWTYRDYLDEKKGIPPRDWLAPAMGNLNCPKCGEIFSEPYKYAWLNRAATERLGYPTQKPESLLDLLIRVSSKKGDLVLDPFCGCGTTMAVAERLNRCWIGIDITHIAITLIKHRLDNTFGPELSPYKVIGDPKDLASAKALAKQDPYQFEWWAFGLIDARPADKQRKGADAGIDGYIYFFDDNTNKAKGIIVQVKSGHVTVSQIRDLKGVMKREGAQIGAFITLKEPTTPMIKEAATAGFYEPKYFTNRKFPRIQILTIEELLGGAVLQFPKIAVNTFKKAPRKPKEEKVQNKLV